MTDVQLYNDPAGGTDSSVGTQFRTDHYLKKALIEILDDMYFTPLADSTTMPKHHGKTIKRHHYLPILDERNQNDQGLDASGYTIAQGASAQACIYVDAPDASGTAGAGPRLYFEAESAFDTNEATTKANALLEAKDKVNQWAEKDIEAGGLGLTIDAGATTIADRYTDVVNSSDGLAYALGYRFSNDTSSDQVHASGNLYGSSKDIGSVPNKLPTLTENGGAVNRVGVTRLDLTGTIQNYGFYTSYTEDSLQFDDDAQLEMHVNREMLRAANYIVEDTLQIDLINGAGVIRYAGDATSTSTMSAEGTTIDEVTYKDIVRTGVDLDDNHCPKHTKIIAGSRMTDTKTIGAARIMYVGSELTNTLEDMTDNFGNQAFIPVHKYADAGNVMNGEIGAIKGFRIVVVPRMMKWEAGGAAVSDNPGYYESAVTSTSDPGGSPKYDVFPMLVVGSGSFTTIGFQSAGKVAKFQIKHSKPGSDISFSETDPYGKKGFMSIQWWYGSMIWRPEWIALIKTVAKY